MESEGGDFFCRRITGVHMISLPCPIPALIQGLAKQIGDGRRGRVKPQQFWGDCRGLLLNWTFPLPSTLCGSDTGDQDNNIGFQISEFERTQSTEGSGGFKLLFNILRTKTIIIKDRSGSHVKSVWLQSDEEGKKRNTF